MRNGEVLVLALVITSAAAEGSIERSYGASSEEYHESHPRYEYSYTVKDSYGNNYGHEEKRDGDYTEGSYFNLLPDGATQRVSYIVNGDSGFVADVQYDSTSKESDSYNSQRRGSREFKQEVDQLESRGQDTVIGSGRFGNYGRRNFQDESQSRSRGGSEFDFLDEETVISGSSRSNNFRSEGGSKKEKKEEQRSKSRGRTVLESDDKIILSGRKKSESEFGDEESTISGSGRSNNFIPQDGLKDEAQSVTEENEDSKIENSNEESVFGGGGSSVYFRPRAEFDESTKIFSEEDDEGDSTFLDLSEFFNFRPQIRYQPS